MWNKIADDATIMKTVKALEANQFLVTVVNNAIEAKKEIETLIPAGSQVMQMSSETLDNTGISDMINSDNFDAIKPKLWAKGENALSPQEKAIAANLAKYSVGSLQAITGNGELVIASNTGSQMAAYVYGSEKVIFVVGAQKLVKDIDAAMKRIYGHVLPLESERVKKAYGMEKSNVSKLLIINKETQPERIHIVIVKESLGF
ncbi:MAG TPA: LUD domain-containing protein [Candidatus Dojkabacteria bacterium]|nr:LUD domain-containing protein [Candidatus Dojkabacteria bacterium]HRP51767.1 LUD domain-containing protein [Candidatus Dojkabacteria bacterium]